MARYVIDAPTLVQVIERGDELDSRHQLVAPGSVRSQALDLLLTRVHRGELDEAEALRLHERLTETKIRLLNDRVSRRRAWTLARQQGWTSLRDAEYLAGHARWFREFAATGVVHPTVIAAVASVTQAASDKSTDQQTTDD